MPHNPGTLGATLDAMGRGEWHAERFADPSGRGPPATMAEWDISVANNDAAGEVWQWLENTPGFAELITVLRASFDRVTAADGRTLAARAALAAGTTLNAVLALPLPAAVEIVGKHATAGAIPQSEGTTAPNKGQA